MGDANNSFTGLNFAVAAFINNRITQDVDMVTLRVNYRFGGYGATGGAPLLINRLSPAGRTLAPATSGAFFCHRAVLISRYFDFSSKLGRQKCRPFCWRLHV